MGQTRAVGLRSNQKNYQQCFIGHSQGVSWRETFEQVCEEVLPNFDLEPWYAEKHFQGKGTLRQKVVNMIATTRYGIYDLSYWRKNDQSAWIMPRNVLIELGMAIALNRPMVLLRHGRNRECGLSLPACLEGIDIGEFGDGKTLLKEALNARLPVLTQHTPRQDWLNRYCHFGGLECSYREVHPLAQQWGKQKIHIHVSDGTNATHIDCRDFHDMIEEDVIGRFNDLDFNYLDSLACPQGCKFLLCSRCQEVRSSPFAIYRITPEASADTFIAIGMSIALEKQFSYDITKILITENADNIPSLLKGYEVIEERDFIGMADRLNSILPEVIEETKQTAWKPRPLPFEVFLPPKVTPPAETPVEQEAKAVTSGVSEKEEEVVNSLVEEEVVGYIDDIDEKGMVQVQSAGKDSAAISVTNDRIERPVYFLLRKKSGEVLREYSLNQAEIKIGRAPNSDILLDQDTLASRNHATVHYENGQYVLQDEGSRNGTFVNGQRLEGKTFYKLRDGDRVEIGAHELIFHSFGSGSITREATRNRPVNVFISYAHSDRALLNSLRAHLRLMEGEGLIKIWHDGDVMPGMDRASEIDKWLNAADLILLLVSSDFLASDSCHREMQLAMQRHVGAEAGVIPILLRPAAWRSTSFGKLAPLPTNAQPITRWVNRDEALVNVAEGILQVVQELQKMMRGRYA